MRLWFVCELWRYTSVFWLIDLHVFIYSLIWLIGWMIEWLSDLFINLIDWLIEWLFDSFINWLIDWFALLTDALICWSTEFDVVFLCCLRCRMCETVFCLTNEPRRPLRKNLGTTRLAHEWFCPQYTVACYLVVTPTVQDDSSRLRYLSTSEHHADQPVEVSASLSSLTITLYIGNFFIVFLLLFFVCEFRGHILKTS